MTNKEAYDHGYNGTLTFNELTALFPVRGIELEEPSQISAFNLGCEDAAFVSETPMTDVEADADTLASAGWGTEEDYGYAADMW